MVLTPPLAAAAAFSSPRGRCPLLLLLQPPPTSPSSSPPSPPFAVAPVRHAPATDITLNAGAVPEDASSVSQSPPARPCPRRPFPSRSSLLELVQSYLSAWKKAKSETGLFC